MNFNLVDSPFIGGIKDSQYRLFGLREILTDAHNIDRIECDSPLAIPSIYRLLLAILHRAYDGPKNKKEWQEIKNKGKFDSKKINEYLDQWKERFNLFGEKPFYQVQLDGDEHPISSLECSQSNTSNFFDHRSDYFAKPVDCATAAIYLITAQSYSVPGGHSEPFNFSSSSLFCGLSFFLHGNNLFETLLFNMLYYDKKENPIYCSENDCPCWERDKYVEPERGYVPQGYLDLLTIQSRRIRLIRDNEQVGKCTIKQGFSLSVDFVDPFKCYENRKDKFFPIRCEVGRATWRDSQALFGLDGVSPKALVEFYKKCPEKKLSSISAFGIAADQAKPLMWKQELFLVPSNLMDNEDFKLFLRQSIKIANDSYKILRSVSKKTMEDLLLKRKKMELRLFWELLGDEFKHILIEFKEDGSNLLDFLEQWKKEVWSISLRAYEKEFDFVGLDKIKIPIVNKNWLKRRIGKVIFGEKK